MNKIVLMMSVAIFTLNISESLAGEHICLGSTGKWKDTGESCQRCGNDCNWELVPIVDDNDEPVYGASGRQAQTLSITGSGKMNDFYVDHYGSSAPWNPYSIDIYKVNVGSGITNIGLAAFYEARSLTNVSIPDTVESIGGAAFKGTKLVSVNIPDSVKSIGDSSFSAINSLTNINFGEDSELKSIGESAFYGSGLTSIWIPDGVTTIGNNAFSGNTGYPYSVWKPFTNLTSIKLPSSLTSIAPSAFSYCTKLKEFIVPETLTADKVAQWPGDLGLRLIENITCIKADGSEGGDESACITAIERFLPDDNGECQTGVNCFTNLQKIGDTCVGKYFGSVNNDGTCTTKSSCTNGGNLINTDTRQCMTPASCTGMYVADTVNKKCFKMPGCVNYADNACQECDSGYLRQSGACVEASACNGRNYASGDECKEMPEGCIGMSGDSCATCDGEHLEKDGSCISASAGCGAGYRQFENFCNRIQYTPAEAAPLLNDDDNFVILTFKK